MKKLILLSLMTLTNAWGNPSNELTLHFIPSPHGMDWTTPSTLAKSALINRISFKPRFIGHVFVELKCGTEHELTGMVGKHFDYLNQLLLEQKGLGILYHSFQGTLESKEAIIPELSKFQEEGYSNFVTFKISEPQCQRAISYLKEYRANDYGKFYGLANRPRFGEGAGCSAFGASFVDVLNIMDDDIKNSWSHTVKIPLAFSGPPLNKEGVNLLKIMFNAGSWAKDGEPFQELMFWDPDRMHTWVKNKVQSKDAGYEIVKSKNADGVIIDKTTTPLPSGPIWLNQTGPEEKTSLIAP